jgi:hypothetical protein
MMRWLGPRARRAAQLQNDFAAFLKQREPGALGAAPAPVSPEQGQRRPARCHGCTPTSAPTGVPGLRHGLGADGTSVWKGVAATLLPPLPPFPPRPFALPKGIRVGTQPQAEEALGFLRLNESHKAYVSSVLAAFGVPMFHRGRQSSATSTPWTTWRPR